MSFSCIRTAGHSVFFHSGEREKSHFGRETVSRIDCSTSAHLNGTTVDRGVNAGSSIHAADVRASFLNAGSSVTVTNSLISGEISSGSSIHAVNVQSESLNAGSSVTVTNSSISGGVCSGSSTTAMGCSFLGYVDAGSSATLTECPSVESVSAGSRVSLDKVVVHKDVSSGSNADIKNSEIGGTLTCVSNHLIIEGSQIDTIRVFLSGSLAFQSGNVIINGSSIITNIGSNVSVFSIQDGYGKKRVWVNGVPLEDLQSKQAPEIKQVIELRNCTVKNIIFEGGNGEVVLAEGSKLTGTITGGKLKD